MTRTLAQAKKDAGVEDRLFGEALKNVLIERRIPIYVTAIAYGEKEYGPSIEVSIDLKGALDNYSPVLSFGQHPDRDPELLAMGDASPTPDGEYGPLALERYGPRKFQKLVDY